MVPSTSGHVRPPQRPSPAGSAVSPARACALAVIRRVFEQGAWADRALPGEAAGLEARERALATRLAYGTIQRRDTLDHVIVALSGRAIGALDPPVLAVLRLGLYQLLLCDGIAAHAAVHESVEQAKAGRRGPSGLVNAVLRRAVTEGPLLLEALDDTTCEGAALRHSLPRWLAGMWWEAFGPTQARTLMARVNEPAEMALRANRLLTTPGELAGALPAGTRGVTMPPEALVCEGAFDAHGSSFWREGAFMPQSRASMLVAHALAPVAGERILDLCSAPGAKTTHIAALMGDQGHILSIERHRGRARALRRTCERMRVTCVTVAEADARCPPTAGESFDRVLVDPPCSGLGTLQSRPDLRWRASPQAIGELAAQQAEILDAAAAAVRPGGLLVYSTCTLSPRENELTLERFGARHPDFEPAPAPSDLAAWEDSCVPGRLLVLPHRHHTDGFFIARLHRRAGSAR